MLLRRHKYLDMKRHVCIISHEEAKNNSLSVQYMVSVFNSLFSRTTDDPRLASSTPTNSIPFQAKKNVFPPYRQTMHHKHQAPWRCRNPNNKERKQNSHRNAIDMQVSPSKSNSIRRATSMFPKPALLEHFLLSHSLLFHHLVVLC